MSASAKCPICGVYVDLDDYWPHIALCEKGIAPSPKTRRNPSRFKWMTHKQVLDFYELNPFEIEEGLSIKAKEVAILRGRIDLVGIDKNQLTCFIEVVHRSHYDQTYWEKKIRSYKTHALWFVGLISRVESQRFNDKLRLMIVRPGHDPVDIK